MKDIEIGFILFGIGGFCCIIYSYWIHRITRHELDTDRIQNELLYEQI